MKFVFCCLLPLASIFYPLAANAQSAPPALQPVIAKCESCHGLHGDSSAVEVPRINGQQRDYIVARLREFRDVTRGTPHATNMMWDMATSISDDNIEAVARYFADQAPTSPLPNGERAAQGAKLYQTGTREVGACASCHGAAGEGHGSVPRLAGQHATYLYQQLQVLMLSLRASDPMNHQIYHMNDEQMKDLVAYLANN